MAKKMLSNLAAIAQNTQSSNIRMIDIDDLHPSPDNFFEVRNIPEFAATILGQGGVKDNLLVTPLESGGYEIISGHRRTAAVRYLLDNGKTISRLLPCLVQSYNNGTDKQLDLILCNVATRQISDQEMWRSFEELDSLLKERKEAGEKFGSIREYLANLLHVSAAQVSKMQNVTHNAIEPVKEAVANGDLSIHAANEIAKLPEEQQEELASGDLSEVTPKDIKKKSATSSIFSVETNEPEVMPVDDQKIDEQKTFTDAIAQEEKVETSSNLQPPEKCIIEFKARETLLLYTTLIDSLKDCDKPNSIKAELQSLIQKFEDVLHEKT